MTEICIAICTRARPMMLKNCMLSLLPQLVDSDCGDSLVIVENDSVRTCESLVENLSKSFPEVHIHYFHEPAIGIPIARNRCLDIAFEQGAEWLAFIDDDEIAEDGWLEAMRCAARTIDAEALVGPVNFTSTANIPIWMKYKKVNKKPRGQLLATAATNNTMIQIEWLKGKGTLLRFDETMRYSGGSDTDFFYRFTDSGGRIAWVDDALVSEPIIEDRLSLTWQLKRTYRTAANAYRNYKKRLGILGALIKTIPKAFGRIVIGIGKCLIGAGVWLLNKRRGSRLLFSGSKALASALGSIFGIFGMEPEPYKTIVGY